MKEEKKIKTVKGFDNELKCRNKPYEVGQTYTEEGDIEVCEHGMHAISPEASPLSVFEYYPPSVNGKLSRYCEVVAEGDVKDDGQKIAASKLTVGAEIGIPGLVKAHVEWVKERLIDDNEHKASNTGRYSSAEVSGKDSVAIATGYHCKAKGSKGCAIVVAERGEWNGETYPLIGIKAAIVDGETIKVDTWYTVENGEWKELQEQE